MGLNRLRDRLFDEIEPHFRSIGKYATGETVRSFQLDIDKQGSDIVMDLTADQSASAILTGRRPNSIPPPVGDIREWLAAINRDVTAARLVADAIGERGIAPFDWVTGLQDRWEPIIQDEFNKGAFDDEVPQVITLFNEFGRIN